MAVAVHRAPDHLPRAAREARPVVLEDGGQVRALLLGWLPLLGSREPHR